MYTSELRTISFPILLNKRIFWLSKTLPTKSTIKIDKAIELLKYKYEVENEFGFDHLDGNQEMELHSSELRELLFDIFSTRGIKMLDVAIYNEPISVNVRYREDSTESSQILANNYIQDFLKIYHEIAEILNK